MPLLGTPPNTNTILWKTCASLMKFLVTKSTMPKFQYSLWSPLWMKGETCLAFRHLYLSLNPLIMSSLGVRCNRAIQGAAQCWYVFTMLTSPLRFTAERRMIKFCKALRLTKLEKGTLTDWVRVSSQVTQHADGFVRGVEPTNCINCNFSSLWLRRVILLQITFVNHKS